MVAAVAEDRLFYDLSGGGVTLSGGEPTAQPRFARAVLQGCRDAGIDTAVETCGSGPWREWTALLPHVDLVLLDLKEIDPVRHRELTGVSNRIILANARRLAAQGVPLIVRRPLIPGHNDSLESLHALGRFVRELDTVREVDLLPYHRMGSAKYERLGRALRAGRPTLPLARGGGAGPPGAALLRPSGQYRRLNAYFGCGMLDDLPRMWAWMPPSSPPSAKMA